LISETKINLRYNTMKGTVKFFNAQKHFGFITGEDGKEYFVHSSGLKEGAVIDKEDSVEFEAEQGDKGLKAVKVEKA
jgi:cold shock protein